MNKTVVNHTVGLIFSIVLTLLAVYVMLYTGMSLQVRTSIIVGFAFIQALVQLLMFMHLTEGRDGRATSFKVLFAVIITLIIVIGTYWVMVGGHSSHL
ncbi:cytochrome aa3 quinol oxidase subunit IV [Mammaliicoccus lentus]|uniref:cytochrome aa3 quinol oxidase subunit IV n=1 Tax=Mammaliicoccus lentus TaxID=42858 RepID=UPI001C4E5410|nr:cytochrome aa3 quinol oxidase subunit IV [Mammaliicoccus lentus]MBW0761487.1 cytochrome aa3 quinol oxidase subunit IV [Mammaliicoccus lentus]